VQPAAEPEPTQPALAPGGLQGTLIPGLQVLRPGATEPGCDQQEVVEEPDCDKPAGP